MNSSFRRLLAVPICIFLGLIANSPSLAQLQCVGPPLAGAVCSTDSDCWACSGGLASGSQCTSSADCPGQCADTPESCLSDNDCTQDVCQDVGATCVDAAGPGVCSDTGDPCVVDTDCGRCQNRVASCQIGVENSCGPANTCEGVGFCQDEAVCFDSSLPVELVSIDAVVDDNQVVLSWATATEFNNAGFAVEMQSKSERDAGLMAWTELGFVEGLGTTNVRQEYSFRVRNPGVGLHRFRLRQVDFDGAFEYSPEVEVTIAVPDQFVLEPAYPNPFNPTTTIRFSVAKRQAVIVTLHDASGRMVRELYRGSPPENEMKSVRIDAGGLASGQYQIKVQGETFTASEHVTLVK